MQGGVGGGRCEASPYPDPALQCWVSDDNEINKPVKRATEIPQNTPADDSAVRFADLNTIN
jgi:hypothetical protein